MILILDPGFRARTTEPFIHPPDYFQFLFISTNFHSPRSQGLATPNISHRYVTPMDLCISFTWPMLYLYPLSFLSPWLRRS
jgi:hypothetical protein